MTRKKNVILKTNRQFLIQECISPFLVPATASGFVSDGPYHFARHPMYGGVLLFSSGLTLITNSLDRAVLTILLAIVLNQTASLEEAVLRKVYPQVEVIIVFL